MNSTRQSSPSKLASYYPIVIALFVNLTIRRIVSRRADDQDRRVEEEAYERANPDEFALEDE